MAAVGGVAAAVAGSVAVRETAQVCRHLCWSSASQAKSWNGTARHMISSVLGSSGCAP